MIKELDYSEDGEISPEEFAAWWLAGRKESVGGRFHKLIEHKLGNSALKKNVVGLIE